MTQSQPAGLPDEAVEEAAKAMADDWNPERDPILTAMFRDYATTALEAAAPLIAAKALRDAANDLERRINKPGLILLADKYGGFHAGERHRAQREVDVLRARANRIEARDV